MKAKATVDTQYVEWLIKNSSHNLTLEEEVMIALAVEQRDAAKYRITKQKESYNA